MAPQTLPQNFSRLPISPSTNSPSRHSLSPRTPSFSDSAWADPNLQSGDPDSVIFSVLCMFDFTSREAGILSFRKYEILDIVKCTDGWWAAMRKGGSTLGWIPQTFVNPLSQEMAERLRGIREELRGAEFKRVKGLHHSTKDTSLSVGGSLPPSPMNESETLVTDSSSSSWSAYPGELLDIRKEQPIINLSQSPSRLSPTTLTHDLTRSASAQTNPPSRSSLPQPNSIDDSRMRAGSPPTAIHRRQPVIVDDDVALSRISSLIKSTSDKQIDNLATSDRETLAPFRSTSNVVHRQIQEDKLSRKFSESGVVSLTALSNVVNKQIPKDKGKAREAGGPIINIGHLKSEGSPWYLRPRYADELEVDNKGNVRSGSLLSLFEMLTTDPGAFGHTKLHQGGELALFDTFTSVFLMTFRTFTTADQLFDMLVERFHLKPEKSLTEYEYIDWKTNFRNPMQHVVLDVFSSWLVNYQLLEEEPHIAQRLKDFLTLIVSPPHSTAATTILQTIDRLTSTNPIRVASYLTPRKGRKFKSNKSDLFKLDPKSVAEQLAVYEFGLYAKITPQQCLAYTKSHTGNDVERLRDFCSTHDKLSAWVKMSILNSDATGKRALTVEFWIKVAERCRMLNNISSMSAIITALSSTAITELHLTWAHTSRKPVLDGLLRYSQPTGGFAGYRSLLQQAAGPCVPFITMFLTEMAHVQDQFSETEGRIYFYQRVRWYETITAMLRFQSRPYNIAADESIISFIEGHLREGSCCDPGWFWKRSQEVQKAEVTHADIRKGLEAAGF